MRGLNVTALLSMDKSSGSERRHVALPIVSPPLWTSIVATNVPAAAPARISVTDASNGPIPDTMRRAATARAPIERPIARNTVPWTCELALSFSPSGLHRSQSPTSSGTGSPHRAHGWVADGTRGAEGLAGDAGAAGAVIAV